MIYAPFTIKLKKRRKKQYVILALQFNSRVGNFFNHRNVLFLGALWDTLITIFLFLIKYTYVIYIMNHKFDPWAGNVAFSGPYFEEGWLWQILIVQESNLRIHELDNSFRIINWQFHQYLYVYCFAQVKCSKNETIKQPWKA